MNQRLGRGALLLVVALVSSASGCKKTSEDTAPAATAVGSGVAAARAGSSVTSSASAAAWLLESKAAELTCGAKPLAIPAAVAAPPVADRALPRAPALAVCQDQPSVEAVCACLVASTEPWIQGTGMSAPVTCQPAPQGAANARLAEQPPTGGAGSAPPPRGASLVELRGAPADPDSVRPGNAYVLVAAHGAAWSAVAIVEHAPDIDLSETPKASHAASITRFETRPRGDATLVWIESDNQYAETAMMEQEVNGAAAVTVCIVSAQAPYCHAQLKRAIWDYTFAITKAEHDDACEIRSAAVWSARLDAAGVLTVQLERGTDKTGAAGRYRL